jgi:glycopeptide antibiotics resistance protein
MPLGFLLPLLFFKFNSLKKVFLVSVVVSVCIELLQFILSVGSLDIDDVILNTIGGILGYLILYVMIFLSPRTFKSIEKTMVKLQK